ncbi:MAG: hypothetical protein CMK92_06250 [Pseudomonas sp.]|nr:hypothetical protein [Pseudomonas sp.]|tara:strand:+ start:1246 stop:1440 length:195 start_codon:yes stop_codon:yes gene_type:complete
MVKKSVNQQVHEGLLKKKSKREQGVSIRLSEEAVTLLDEYCEKYELSRGEVIDELLLNYFDEIE